MADYSVHKLQKEDFTLLVPLMKDCFGMDVNIKYFEWKFTQNPSGLVEGYYAKDENDEVAAYYGVIPENFMFNGEERTIYQSCDTMTHSKHRRQGLFKELALKCYEHLRNENKLFIYGFGGGQSTPGFVKFGWDIVFDVKNYFYPKQFNLFAGLKYENVEEVSDVKQIEHLTMKSNESAPLHSLKNYERYSWRVSNPLYDYKTVGFKSGGEKYTSYLTYYEANNKIMLFDCYVSDKEAGKNLFNYLKSKIKNDLVGIVSFCQEDTAYSTMLKDYRFISNPFGRGPLHEKTPFIFYTTEEEQKAYKHAKFWLINTFDHDAL